MALPAPFVPPVTSAVRTHRGRAEIDAWIDDTIDLSTTTVTLLGARTVDDMVGASYRLEGDFPGGVVELEYQFWIDEQGRITKMDFAAAAV